MHEMREPIDVLREAREYYREHGGAKGEYRDAVTGKVCAVGAYSEVAVKCDYNGSMSTEEDRAFMALIRSCLTLHGSASISGVNDTTDDPYPVIMDLYDHAIKEMENG